MQLLSEWLFPPFWMKLVDRSLQRQNLLTSPRFPCPILLSWGDFSYIDCLRKPIPCNFLEEMSKRQPRYSHKSQNYDIFSFLSPKLAKILLLIFKVDTFQNFCVISFKYANEDALWIAYKHKWFTIKSSLFLGIRDIWKETFGKKKKKISD